MPPQHAGQPAALLGDGHMSAVLELVVDLSKLGPHPFEIVMRRSRNCPPLPLPADVREAQVIERLGLPEATALPGAGGDTARTR